MNSWKEKLTDTVPVELGREIDVFETQIELKRQGKIDDKIFAETRLRRGAYGQRYDNGQRDDGSGPKMLLYPCRDMTKGPDTVWDAPGMQRIKIPFGRLSADQLELLADLAEEYSDGICHITTRQDVQFHFVYLEDTPDLMRRLAGGGITTREACGNTVRNVTACPIAGVCGEEAFDVTPYALACSTFMLGHPDAQDFGRKFKIAFSGCRHRGCGLASMHDLGFIARERSVGGQVERGFEVYVGGGLGAVPHQAKLFADFVPVSEILPLAQALSRVFARLGEKKNRARARLKFVVAKLGIEEFRRMVLEERNKLRRDDAWTEFLSDLQGEGPPPREPGRRSSEVGTVPGFGAWRKYNIQPQRQQGYVVATVALPLGDISAAQLRALASASRRWADGEVRATVEQNIVLRWVAEDDCASLYRDLDAAGLSDCGGGGISDIVACPGTDTCKLGIASSRGLAAELRRRLGERGGEMDEAVRGLRVKVSGCFNSCGQHHLADIGFYGVSRNFSGRTVPHFQVVLGGQWRDNAGAYGLAIGAVPSKRIPAVVDRLCANYLRGRLEDESFQDYCRRSGKKNLKGMLSDLMKVPSYQEDSSLYSDWRDPREFSIGDLGVGECAGEVVSLAEFDMAEAERRAFEAQLLLEDGKIPEADEMAYGAMLEAARALIRLESAEIADDPAKIAAEFESRFHLTGRFHDKYAGAKFSQYFLQRHAESGKRAYSAEAAHRLIEESLLFIEASHACQARIAVENGAVATKSS